MLLLPRTFTELYTQRAALDQQHSSQEREKKRLKKALEYASLQCTALGLSGSSSSSDGFHRMASCRKALDALDRRGWERSYHQRYFHDHFIRACARVFWKVVSLPPATCLLAATQRNVCRWRGRGSLPRTTKKFWS